MTVKNGQSSQDYNHKALRKRTGREKVEEDDTVDPLQLTVQLVNANYYTNIYAVLLCRNRRKVGEQTEPELAAGNQVPRTTRKKKKH